MANFFSLPIWTGNATHCLIFVGRHCSSKIVWYYLLYMQTTTTGQR